MLRFLLSCVLSVTLSAGLTGGETTTPSVSTSESLPELTFSTQDLDLLIHSSDVVNLTLSYAPKRDFNITFIFDEKMLEDIEPIQVCRNEAKEYPVLTWSINLNTTKNGKTNLIAVPDIIGVVNDENAFIRLGVMINPAINVGADVMGWIYTIAWDIPPQIYHNWRRKSVVGVAFDYLALNFIGHFSYMMYNVGNLWFPEIQDEFHERNPMSVMHVRLNDVICPAYALLCNIIQIVQCFIYKRDPDQRVSTSCRIILAILTLSEVSILIIAASSDLLWWLDLLLWLSYVKVITSFIKYIPQLYMNFKLKSTEGWSIWQVILDFIGGLFSIIQMLMIAANYDDWISVLTDPAKLGLGLLSILFNIFFFMQHYCLYRGAKITSHATSGETLKGVDPSKKISSSTTKKNLELKGEVNPDPEVYI